MIRRLIEGGIVAQPTDNDVDSVGSTGVATSETRQRDDVLANFPHGRGGDGIGEPGGGAGGSGECDGGVLNNRKRSKGGRKPARTQSSKSENKCSAQTNKKKKKKKKKKTTTKKNTNNEVSSVNSRAHPAATAAALVGDEPPVSRSAAGSRAEEEEEEEEEEDEHEEAAEPPVRPAHILLFCRCFKQEYVYCGTYVCSTHVRSFVIHGANCPVHIPTSFVDGWHTASVRASMCACVFACVPEDRRGAGWFVVCIHVAEHACHSSVGCREWEYLKKPN